MTTLSERALSYLREGPRPALDIVRDVLQLQRANQAVADRLATALLGADPRFTFDLEGRWSLVPEPAWMSRWARSFTIENGLLLGLAMFLAGLFWSVSLTLEWGRSGFGPLDPVETMRAAIPAVTLMAGGMQVSIGSFFSGALHFCWRSARQN